MSLRDRRKDTLLEGLKLTSNVIAQREIFFKIGVQSSSRVDWIFYDNK